MKFIRMPIRLQFAVMIIGFVLVASIAWLIVHFSTTAMNRTLAGNPQELEPILRHHIRGVAHLWAKERPDPDAPDRWFIVEPDPHLASLLEAYYGSRVQIIASTSDAANLAMTAKDAEFVLAIVSQEDKSSAVVEVRIRRKKDAVRTKLFLEYANDGWKVTRTESLPEPLIYVPAQALRAE
jgi:hypothetical protein